MKFKTSLQIISIPIFIFYLLYLLYFFIVPSDLLLIGFCFSQIFFLFALLILYVKNYITYDKAFTTIQNLILGLAISYLAFNILIGILYLSFPVRFEELKFTKIFFIPPFIIALAGSFSRFTILMLDEIGVKKKIKIEMEIKLKKRSYLDYKAIILFSIGSLFIVFLLILFGLDVIITMLTYFCLILLLKLYQSILVKNLHSQNL